jgi:hypothetical protein
MKGAGSKEKLKKLSPDDELDLVKKEQKKKELQIRILKKIIEKKNQ